MGPWYRRAGVRWHSLINCMMTRRIGWYSGLSQSAYDGTASGGSVVTGCLHPSKTVCLGKRAVSIVTVESKRGEGHTCASCRRRSLISRIYSGLSNTNCMLRTYTFSVREWYSHAMEEVSPCGNLGSDAGECGCPSCAKGCRRGQRSASDGRGERVAEHVRI